MRNRHGIRRIFQLSRPVVGGDDAWPYALTTSINMEVDEYGETTNNTDVGWFDYNEAFSVSVWVYSDNFAVSNRICATINTAAHGGWLWDIEGNVHRFFCQKTSSSNGSCSSNSVSALTGQWNHFVLTVNTNSPLTLTNKVLFYTNNVSSVNAGTNLSDGTWIPGTKTPFQLSRFGWFGTWYYTAAASNMLMTDLCVFDWCLSSAEVSEIFNSGFPLNMSTFSGFSTLDASTKSGLYLYERGIATPDDASKVYNRLSGASNADADMYNITLANYSSSVPS